MHVAPSAKASLWPKLSAEQEILAAMSILALSHRRRPNLEIMKITPRG